mmetsp:Transcript_4870/g.15938  ORF Transcript_4870/g.15938 Transcript_4870/m.15938 type:complete len:618 (+) Transcript_4870:219-2072(+)
MLDFFYIFNKGGMILWQLQLATLRGNPLGALIKTVLLQERSGDAQFNCNTDNTSYTLKWDFHNELDLVFVAVYQSILSLPYVDGLLGSVKREFTACHFRPRKYAFPEFHDVFTRLLDDAEKQAEELKRPKQAAAFDPSKKSGVRGADKKGATKDATQSAKPSASTGFSAASAAVAGTAEDGQQSGKEDSSAENAAGFDLSKLKGRRGKEAKAAASPSKPKVDSASNSKEEKKKPKKARVWEEGPAGGKLDFSKKKDPEQLARDMALKEEDKGQSRMDEDYVSSGEETEEDFTEESESGTESDASGIRAGGWFSSIMKNVVGAESLSREDIAPVIEAMKHQLMTKNVAEGIAEKLCESVAASLEGKKMPSFTRVSTTVKAALQVALEKILSPKRSTDVLREVQACREKGDRPYTIVFVGVNGVGKSTNLAKVAYWLQQNGMDVMLCACDTFRSGAVEQLRTHAQRLQVDLFERGYEKDPAAVAFEGIKQGGRSKKDVVLIDTAGRMQDNEPLMRALAKLVNMNEPDLVLFVGEALVGNDAVDQLSKFSQRLEDLSTKTPPRVIDGIVLTKFDTIDDKVGAALSMVYTSGAPIMFVGCGQTYTDLRKLNVKHVVKSLLS